MILMSSLHFIQDLLYCWPCLLCSSGNAAHRFHADVATVASNVQSIERVRKFFCVGKYPRWGNSVLLLMFLSMHSELQDRRKF